MRRVVKIALLMTASVLGTGVSGCTMVASIPGGFNLLKESGAISIADAQGKISGIFDKLKQSNQKFVSATEKIQKAANIRFEQSVKSQCNAAKSKKSDRVKQVDDAGKCIGEASKAIKAEFEKSIEEQKKLPRLGFTHIALAAKDLWDMKNLDKQVLLESTELAASLSSGAFNISSFTKEQKVNFSLENTLNEAKAVVSSTSDRLVNIPEFISIMVQYSVKFDLVDDVISYIVKIPTGQGGAGDYEALIELFKAAKELSNKKS